MTRLVNAMRDGIVSRLMKHSFDDQRRAFQAEHAALAMTIYNDIYIPAVRKRMNGWLNTASNIQISYAGTVGRFEFDGDYGKYVNGYDTYLLYIATGEPPKVMRFPWEDLGSTLKVYEATDPIAEQIVEFMTKRSNLIETIKKAEKQATATVEAYTTVEKLIEAWPEIEPFIDEKDRLVPITAVALPVEALNDMFKLPAVTADV